MTDVRITFRRRTTATRPTLSVDVSRVSRDMWQLFRPYHYMSADIVKQAACFAAFVSAEPVAFVAMCHFPHPVSSARGFRVHRLVTLPDWQGIGLGMLLLDCVCSAYYAVKSGNIRMPAAHPSLIRVLDRSLNWAMTKRPGIFTEPNRMVRSEFGRMGGRACAVFRYCGPALDPTQAAALISSNKSTDGSINPNAPRQGIGRENRTGDRS